MSIWIVRGLVLAALVGLIAVRAPHGQRSLAVPVAHSAKDRRETLLLTLAWVSFFVPVAWLTTPLLAFADFATRPWCVILGVLASAAGLMLLHRSHADLGTNWSITLEIRNEHQLITHGIYRHIRHPMYLALLVYSLGLALLLPNWVAGPVYLVAFVVLVAFRLGREEALMRAQFGAAYDAYVARTHRLLPGIF